MKHLVASLVLGLSLIVGANLIASPRPPATLTITGEAKMDSLPQISSFNASVDVFNDDKDTAVNQVNTAMDKLITAVKEFGVASEDIQTQQVSVSEVNGGPEILIYHYG